MGERDGEGGRGIEKGESYREGGREIEKRVEVLRRGERY